jgi:hypothetical protein
MRFFIWTLGAVLMLLSASCDLLNPTSNQSTIQASNQYGNSCPIVANLDGNNSVTIGNGTFYTFPLVGAGNHTLNFSTSGTCSSANCVFSNGSSSQSVNFNTVGGKIYVGTVKQNGGSCNTLIESGP